MCDLPVDWVDTSHPVWCCASCDALVNGERDDWPFCAACATPMAQVIGRESPPDLSAARSHPLLVAAHVAYAVCVFAQLVALAIDRFAFAFVAPILVLFAIGALAFLVVMPLASLEILALIRDRKTRVVHGLEHATIAVLAERGVTTFEGQTRRGAFGIAVERAVSLRELRDAVVTAVARVRAGERGLAYTRRCGTSLLVALLLVSLVIVGGGIAGVIAGVAVNVLAGAIALGIVFAWLAARPLGLLAQRFVTVSTRFASACVGDIARDVSATGEHTCFTVAIRVDE